MYGSVQAQVPGAVKAPAACQFRGVLAADLHHLAGAGVLLEVSEFELVRSPAVPGLGRLRG
jgi:hypothetical protein